MRVLIASTAGSGHFGPLVPFADALTERGDELLFVVPPELEARVAHASYRLGEAAPADFWDGIHALPRREQAIRGNRDWFGRLCTAAMRPAMEAAFDEWRPDLVLRDPCDFASAIAAEARRCRTLPWRARAATSSGPRWTSSRPCCRTGSRPRCAPRPT